MNVQAKDRKGWSALHYASNKGYGDVIRTLIKLDGNPRGKDDLGLTPLHCAAEKGHEAAVRMLVEYGAETNDKDDADWTSLFHATSTGAVSVVRLLIQLGSDPNEKDLAGLPAGQYASLNGHQATAQTLVELGAKSNHDDYITANPVTCCIIPVYWKDEIVPTILSLPISSTVTEVLHQMRNAKQEFPTPSMSPTYSKDQIMFRKRYKSYNERVLGRNERPLIIQHRLLKQVGYEDRDMVLHACQHDNECLWKFSTTSSNINGHESNNNFSEMTTKIDISGLGIVRFPDNLKVPASKIISINLSRNPGFNMLAHTLEVYPKLTELKMANNRLNQIPGLCKTLRILDLSSNTLKQFPEQLSTLGTLVDLDISFNSIPNLPDIFSGFLALETFTIRNNKLRGTLPQSLGTLKSLKAIDLRSNYLSDISVLFNLRVLEVLLVDNNSISVVIFTVGFENLKTLSLHANPIIWFEIMSPIHELTSLNISNTNLTNINDKVFSKLPKITQLNLEENRLASLPDSIGLLKELRYLSVARNALRAIPSQIGCLKELRSFDARQNKLETLPSDIWLANKLTVLNVSSNSLHGFPACPESLLLSTSSADPRSLIESTFIESLRYLAIADNSLCGVIKELSPLLQLRLLNLSYNKLTHLPLESLQCWPCIEKLYLSGNQLMGIPLNGLGNNGTPLLRVLHLNGNKFKTLPYLLYQATSLSVLDCGSNFFQRHTLDGPPPHRSHRTNFNLKYLNFSGNAGLVLVFDSSPDHTSDQQASIVPVLDRFGILGLEDVQTRTSADLPYQKADRLWGLSGILIMGSQILLASMSMLPSLIGLQLYKS